MGTDNELTEEELWAKYKEDGSQSAREKLILDYVPLVKHIVGKVMISIPDKYSFDDLVNYGILGLMDALERFDPQRGIKFSTYAVPRIKGSIYDEVRKDDWVPQSVRKKSKQFSTALIKLEKELGRKPTDEEIKEELDLNSKQYQKMLSQINIPENISLEKIISFKDNDKITIKDLVKGSKEEQPDQVFDYNKMKEVLGTAIDKLPQKEKLVVSLYYYEDLTLQEIGEIMELTTARISQLHTKSIFRLRGYLGQKKDVLVKFS
ncbi:FliA/WhiG family RNA polymerase sigma factor [Halanaerobacter jeridensis]|uniref:RNA polymerase sigma factor for flagellar operon FliA n=1 Tax=Halanaerobacter jeridensis TaxID=706427 RepID=A0A938XRB6_9FIRM|nr:FliA/WhiG family RNA polymerase sigma factor [Halanaerobacter jeridensis]MBM7555364.1 RNA polymerase sigma factor for flagellar operon FliA [Halanaerobacter jeridensis]